MSLYSEDKPDPGLKIKAIDREAMIRIFLIFSTKKTELNFPLGY
jgi:hypothetical protein